MKASAEIMWAEIKTVIKDYFRPMVWLSTKPWAWACFWLLVIVLCILHTR